MARSYLSWSVFTLGWGVFLLLVVVVLLAVNGWAWNVGLFLLSGLAFVWVWRFPYAGLILAVCGLMVPGITVSIPVVSVWSGERAFGGSIDVALGELMTLLVFLVWAVRIIVGRERDERVSARPWLPLGLGFAAMVLAQVLSAWSAAEPDSLVVFKYALRPVLLVYLAAVALPVNFIRSWQRMDQVCWSLMALAGWFALDGLRSLFIFGGDALGVYRAHPITAFGVNPLGGNHHALAELMVMAAPLALAAAVRDYRRYLVAAAGVFWLVALLTFARAAWLVVLAQLCILAVYFRPRQLVVFKIRQWAREHAVKVIGFTVVSLFLIVYMVELSLGESVAQSTSARAMLLDVAWWLFRDNPIWGAGAGTFASRLEQVRAFAVEFGASQDAHGMWQKVAAETGLVGIAALLGTLGSLVYLARHEWRRLVETTDRAWFVCLGVGAGGALVYQLFSTSLWSARTWLPVGLWLAGMRLMQSKALRRDPDFLR